MVDQLVGAVKREWKSINNDNSEKLSTLSRTLSRKVSDNNTINGHQQNNQHLMNNDQLDLTQVTSLRPPKVALNRRATDVASDTDKDSSFRRRQHHRLTSSSDYTHLISPRLNLRRSINHSTRGQGTTSFQHHISQKSHINGNENYEEKHEDKTIGDDTTHRQGRSSIRLKQGSSNSNSAVRSHHPLSATNSVAPILSAPTAPPFRIILMRHGERANQAFGNDWFIRAFSTNVYRPFDRNLPSILPKRHYNEDYELDVPLTVHGLKSARQTGYAMMNNNYIPDLCLSSSSLRCVQTCERILKGMNRREHIPIRIEPGLFECPHFNQRVVESFMSKKELMDNRYLIKSEYRPIVPKLTVPESVEEYFQRSDFVMRTIIERYSRYGGTVLLVTHAPGLLALTEPMKGLRPNPETFYRTVSTYPPLATVIIEYDGTKWKFSEQPFNFIQT